MLTDAERAELRRAKALLEDEGLAMKLASYVGRPVEWAVARLPARAHELLGKATNAALERALGVALSTLDASVAPPPSRWLHRALVTASGAVGGAFGLAALAVELPFSTTVMLRSIADHARAAGEDLSLPEARLNCLAVFALGGPSALDDADDAGYFAARAALGRAVSEASRHVAERGMASAAERGAPAVVRFLAVIAERFGVSVSEKAAAQAVPVLGALGGAAINALFIRHFEDLALGHFAVRRLERAHGADVVREAYLSIA